MFRSLRLVAPVLLLAAMLGGPAATTGVLAHVVSEHAATESHAHHPGEPGHGHEHDGEHGEHGDAAHGPAEGPHGHAPHDGPAVAACDVPHGADHTHDLGMAATVPPARIASLALDLLPAVAAPGPPRAPAVLVCASGPHAASVLRAAPRGPQRSSVLRI